MPQNANDELLRQKQAVAVQQLEREAKTAQESIQPKKPDANAPVDPVKAVDSLPAASFGTIGPQGTFDVNKIRLPFRSEDNPRGSLMGALIGEGVLSGIEKEAVGTLTSIPNLLLIGGTLGLGTIPAIARYGGTRLLSAYFGLEMGKALWDRNKEYQQTIKDEGGLGPRSRELLGRMLVLAAFTAKAGEHALTEGAPATGTPKPVESKAPTTEPPAKAVPKTPAPESRVNLEFVDAATTTKKVIKAVNQAGAEAMAESRRTRSHAETVEAAKEITVEQALAIEPGTPVDAPTHVALRDLRDNAALDVFSVQGYTLDFYLYGLSLRGGNRGVFISGWTPTFITGLVDNVRVTGNQTGIYTMRFAGGIEDSDISGNTHLGLHNYYSSPTIEQNAFGFNGSGGADAAIYNDQSNPNIINNIIGWNNGSGIMNNNSSPTITNNSIAWNLQGSGVANFTTSNPTVSNNIIALNEVYGIHADATSAPVTPYNDVWGNGWGGYADYYGVGAGAGSISADPRFVSLVDAHLLCSSPAIDAGNNGAPSVPSVDYDGNPRPVGGTVDMGAYEWQSPFRCPAYLPAVLR